MEKRRLAALVIKFQNLAAEASTQGRKLDRRKHSATIGVYNTEAATYQKCAEMLREEIYADAREVPGSG